MNCVTVGWVVFVFDEQKNVSNNNFWIIYTFITVNARISTSGKHFFVVISQPYGLAHNITNNV